jgi:hypothetical protein
MKMFIDPKELLFENRLAPITAAISLIENNCHQVVEAFIQKKEELKKEGAGIRKISAHQVTGSLDQVLFSLLPLQKGGSSRSLFIPTKNNKTAFFENNYRWTDAAFVSILAQRLKCRSFYLVVKPLITYFQSGRKFQAAALIMDVYGQVMTKESLNLIRRIWLERDYKWEFYTLGDPFPFENLEQYQAKRIPDRFSLALLKEYLKALDMFPFQEDFYLPEGSQQAVLVETKTTYADREIKISFEEARRLNYLE